MNIDKNETNNLTELYRYQPSSMIIISEGPHYKEKNDVKDLISFFLLLSCPNLHFLLLKVQNHIFFLLHNTPLFLSMTSSFSKKI